MQGSGAKGVCKAFRATSRSFALSCMSIFWQEAGVVFILKLAKGD